jgi:hypothetical protein
MFDKPHVFFSSALLIPVLGLNITGWMVFSRASFGGGLGKGVDFEDRGSSQLETGWNSLIQRYPKDKTVGGLVDQPYEPFIFHLG